MDNMGVNFQMKIAPYVQVPHAEIQAAQRVNFVLFCEVCHGGTI